MGVSYRASVARNAEYDPKWSLVSTVRLSGDDHQSEDDTQTPPSTGKRQG